jgi:hypothetical protein
MTLMRRANGRSRTFVREKCFTAGMTALAGNAERSSRAKANGLTARQHWRDVMQTEGMRRYRRWISDGKAYLRKAGRFFYKRNARIALR